MSKPRIIGHYDPISGHISRQPVGAVGRELVEKSAYDELQSVLVQIKKTILGMNESYVPDEIYEVVAMVDRAVNVDNVQPSRQSSPWQLIETAPKDGTIVDLWCKPKHGSGFRVTNCLWSGGIENWASSHYPNTSLRRVTHWVPLADPVSTEVQHQGSCKGEKV